MISVFGDVRQIGFMSRDIEQSMKYFIDAWGVGPWYVMRRLKSPMVYKGQPTEPEVSIAMANAGDLQLEIVQQHNDVSSLYLDSLAATPSLHVQHVAVWTDDLVKVRAAALDKGWRVLLETVPEGSTFVAHPDAPAVCIEISDCSPFKNGVREAIRREAANWDGANPIREGVPS
jgi:Glyoxalase/Bleomycin resistance protein/Dioxygenase superfamily